LARTCASAPIGALPKPAEALVAGEGDAPPEQAANNAATPVAAKERIAMRAFKKYMSFRYLSAP
jgi:hypothetical protein